MALRIYPNPAGDYVWIETGKAPNGMEVTLLDLMGRGVRSRSYAPGAVPGTVLFDLQGIGTGIYILKVGTPDTVRAGKIVIR